MLAFLFLFLSFSSASPVLATGPTILYAKSGGLSSGSCMTWKTACDLQYVLTNATAPAQIWVLKGTYKPSQVFDVTATFQLKNGVGLYGGFAGTEMGFGQRSPTTNVTILTGNLGNLAGLYYNAAHVVTGSGTDNTAVLDGFTITGGDAFGFSCPAGCGGGMYNEIGSPTLTNFIFAGNVAEMSGGGMYNLASNPILTHVTFSANQTTDYGGGGAGMYNDSSNPLLVMVTFSGNKSYDTGGGMYNSSSSPTLTNVTFSNNKAQSTGGGMYNDSGSSPILIKTTFSGNSAHDGGGMSNAGGSPTLTSVTFSGNKASSDGGMSNAGGNPTLTNVIFSGNKALVTGGMGSSGSPTLTNVIFVGNQATTCAGGGMTSTGTGNPVLTNVTFSGNRAAVKCGAGGGGGGGGGGLFNGGDSSPTLINVTFSNNSVPNGTGGAIENDSFSPLTIRNSILWGNTATTGAQVFDLYGTLTISDSVVQRGCPHSSTCSNIINANPLLLPLASNGATIKTLALGADSSAINKGNVAFCPATDQRGKLRRTANGYCDIGAYEAQPAKLVVTSGTPQSAPINTAFAKQLVVSVHDGFNNPLGGVPVTFTAPASGASASLVGNPALSNALGLVSVNATANGTSGRYQVKATIAGLKVTVAFRLTNK